MIVSIVANGNDKNALFFRFFVYKIGLIHVTELVVGSFYLRFGGRCAFLHVWIYAGSPDRFDLLRHICEVLGLIRAAVRS
jgi:hypothetical protein